MDAILLKVIFFFCNNGLRKDKNNCRHNHTTKRPDNPTTWTAVASSYPSKVKCASNSHKTQSSNQSLCEYCTNLVKGMSGKHIKRGSNKFNIHRAVIISSSFSLPHCLLQSQMIIKHDNNLEDKPYPITHTKITTTWQKRLKTLMWRTPSNWKHFISISALSFSGWGVIRLLIFISRDSFTSSETAGTTLVTSCPSGPTSLISRVSALKTASGSAKTLLNACTQ